MKTTLFMLICISVLVVQGFSTAQAGGVDLSLSAKNTTGTGILAVSQGIESTIRCLGIKDLDRYGEFQPPSIFGDGFPYPVGSSKLCTDKVLSDRDVSSITNQTQALLIAPARFDQAQGEIKPATTLMETVRQSTARFKTVDEAQAAGYGLFHGCVSGSQEGAMGIHYVNGDLVGDGVLDPMHPEALLYEFKNGQMQLTGVEYIVIAEAWDTNNDIPPVLMGQLLQYAGSPNRYGIPAFYELHVWAWSNNPLGTFSDWNSEVSCDSYTALETTEVANH